VNGWLNQCQDQRAENGHAQADGQHAQGRRRVSQASTGGHDRERRGYQQQDQEQRLFERQGRHR
jgi:hypothetical protein